MAVRRIRDLIFMKKTIEDWTILIGAALMRVWWIYRLMSLAGFVCDCPLCTRKKEARWEREVREIIAATSWEGGSNER